MDSSTPQPAAPEPPEANPRRRTGLWLLLIAALIVLALLVTAYILAYTGTFFVRPDWARALRIPTATPLCARPMLSLGPAGFSIEAAARPADGSLPAPASEPGTAWWVADTFAPFVFLLTPTAEMPDLGAFLQPGDPMVVVWADCGREEFVLSAAESEAPTAAALLAQSGSGIAVIVRPGGGAPAYLLLGERPGLTLVTPEPTDPNAIQAEITFGETVVSQDGQTLTTGLTIANFGGQPISLAPVDLSLAAEGQPPLAPLSVEPALPQEIQPGDSLALAITFPNPGGGTAVLRVLDFTADLYY